MSDENEYESSGEGMAKNIVQMILGMCVIYVGAIAIQAGIFYLAGGGFHFGDWISPEFSALFYSSDWLVFGPTDFAISFDGGDSWWGVCMRKFIFDDVFLQVIQGCVLQVGILIIWLATTVRALAEIF